MKKTSLLAGFMFSFLLSGVASLYIDVLWAEVLLIEDVERAKAMDLPGNGLSKRRVQQSRGEPLQQYAAVGDPPITRWRYQDYSVYFEYDLVISSVLHYQPDNPQSSNVQTGPENNLAP